MFAYVSNSTGARVRAGARAAAARAGRARAGRGRGWRRAAQAALLLEAVPQQAVRLLELRVRVQGRVLFVWAQLLPHAHLLSGPLGTRSVSVHTGKSNNGSAPVSRHITAQYFCGIFLRNNLFLRTRFHYLRTLFAKI
jgi:hypothetical protein